MNKKQLAIKLSRLNGLNDLDLDLEQYQTDSELAAELVWLAYQNKDIENKLVADFGCGNGILGIGALLLGAKFVHFLDLDKNSLNICKENLDLLKLKDYEIICSNVANFNENVNTVIMNPPFGVQKRKADKKFLEKAMAVSNRIYSVHKIESRDFIEKLCSENGFEVLSILERDFIIKKSYKFHKKANYCVKTGIWTISRNKA